jgi:hypothetical protein
MDNTPLIEKLRELITEKTIARVAAEAHKGLGSGSVVAHLASGRDLRAVSAAGVFDYQPERGRLVVLRGGWKLGSVAARVEQGCDAKETFKAASGAVGN